MLNDAKLKKVIEILGEAEQVQLWAENLLRTAVNTPSLYPPAYLENACPFSRKKVREAWRFAIGMDGGEAAGGVILTR